MGSSDPDLAVGTSLSKLSSTVDILEQAGNEKIVFELFLEALTSLIESIVSPDPAQKLTREGLLSAFQIAESKFLLINSFFYFHSFVTHPFQSPTR